MNAAKPAPLATAAPSTRGIAWTGETWNPLIGCTRAGPGRECVKCYAEREALGIVRKSAARGIETPYAAVVHEVGGEAWWTGEVVRNTDAAFRKLRRFRHHADQAERGEVPRLRIFVNSMSDLFHERAVDSGLTRAAVDEMLANPGHDYQILTKRPEVAADYYASDPRLHDHPDIWLGVSVGIADAKGRVDVLRAIPAARRFLSLEPLLEPLGDLDLSGIDWVIAGGESGPRARACDPDWLREIRDRCAAAGAPFFLKQLGGHPDKRAHEKAQLDGRTWTEFPPPLALPRLLLTHDPAPLAPGDGHCRAQQKRASLPVPIDPPSTGGGGGMGGPAAAALREAYRDYRGTEVEKLGKTIRIGQRWLDAQPAIVASNLSPEAWCEAYLDSYQAAHQAALRLSFVLRRPAVRRGRG